MVPIRSFSFHFEGDTRKISLFCSVENPDNPQTKVDWFIRRISYQTFQDLHTKKKDSVILSGNRGDYLIGFFDEEGVPPSRRLVFRKEELVPKKDTSLHSTNSNLWSLVKKHLANLYPLTPSTCLTFEDHLHLQETLTAKKIFPSYDLLHRIEQAIYPHFNRGFVQIERETRCTLFIRKCFERRLEILSLQKKLLEESQENTTLLFKAKNLSTGADVVIKSALTPKGLSIIDTQISTLKKIHEEGIIPNVQTPPLGEIYDTNGQCIGFVDRYYEKRSLLMKMQKERSYVIGGTLTEEEAVRIMWNLSCALERLNEKGLITTDIGLENVFCSGDGGYYLADLGCDFTPTTLDLIPKENHRHWRLIYQDELKQCYRQRKRSLEPSLPLEIRQEAYNLYRGFLLNAQKLQMGILFYQLIYGPTAPLPEGLRGGYGIQGPLSKGGSAEVNELIESLVQTSSALRPPLSEGFARLRERLSSTRLSEELAPCIA